jgi:hypothetical protein
MSGRSLTRSGELDVAQPVKQAAIAAAYMNRIATPLSGDTAMKSPSGL